MSERISTTSHEMTEMRSPSEDELLKMRYRDLARMFRGIGGNIVNTKNGIVAVDSTGNPIKKGAMIDHILSHQPSEDGNVIDNGSTLSHESLTIPMQLKETHKQATIVNELREQLTRLRSSGVPTLEQSMEMNELQHLIEIGEDKIADDLIQYRNDLDNIQDPNMRQVAIQSYNDAEAFIINATEDYIDSPASEPDSQPASQEPVDHEADQSQTAPAKKSFLSKIKDGAKNFVKGTGEIIKRIWSPAIYWAWLTRGAIEKVNNIRPEDFSSDKDYRREKRKAVISAIGPFAIGGVLVTAGTAAIKTGLFLSPAARAAGLVAEGLGDDSIDPSLVDAAQSADVAGVDSGSHDHFSPMGWGNMDDDMSAEIGGSHGDFSPMGWGNYDDDMSLQAGSDTGDAGVMFNHDPSIDVGPHGYDISLDPFFASDKTAEWNMSNGFITNGTPAEAMDDWTKDLFKSPEMMSMFAAESGMEGADDPTTLDDLLTNSPNDYISWSDRIKEMLDQATDVHYETIPAGKEYNTWYTQINNNGDPQLVQSFGISHDKDVTALVFSIKGETYMVNSDCGQLVRYEPTVYDNVPIFNPSDQPSGTPPSPSTEPGPGPGPSPEPEPGHEPEPEPEPAPKDSSTSIDENSEVPEGNKADAVEADLATGSDAEPSEQPGATYTPPVQEQTEQVAPEAQAPQAEQRQAQADQGVEAGDGNQSNSGTVSTN